MRVRSGLLALSAAVVFTWLVAAMWDAPRVQRVDAGPQLQGAEVGELGPGEVTPRPMLAAHTFDRLALFRTGNGPFEMSLGAEEVTALVTERFPGLLPEGVDDVEVEVADGLIVLHASVLTQSYAGAARLRRAIPVLPDTLRAELSGAMSRVGRRLVFEVTAARAHGVPLPARIVDALVLDMPMSVDHPTGPTLEVALPEGIADARVVGDRIVLHATEPNLERTVDGGSDG